MKFTRCFFAHLFCLFVLIRPVNGQSPGQLAHPNDSDKASEHDAALVLVPSSGATHTAVASGSWSSPATWDGGSSPGAGARVWVPSGISVQFAASSSPALEWLRIDGKLTFATATSTHLRVDTIFVSPGGEWEQGTPSAPVAAGVTSTIEFTDTGAISDPLLMGRGFINHGKVTIHGTPRTAFLRTALANYAAGASQITFQSVPSNWMVGDQVVISGCRMHEKAYEGFQSQDELKTITAKTATTLTLDSGLVYARNIQFQDQPPYVANVTRNVRFLSANTTVTSRRGHVMFMHSPLVNISHAGFYDLGRTEKGPFVTDVFEQNGNPPGTNPRGRYSCHFHRTGFSDKNSVPARVTGCAVVRSPGWGYVNHDSHVVFEDCVAYLVRGAQYVTEIGDELGAFRRCIAMDARGGPDPNAIDKDHRSNHDLGHVGNGFWMQSGSVKIEDCVVTSSKSSAYAVITRGKTAGFPFVSSNLEDPAAAGGQPTMRLEDIPIASFKNNMAYACNSGINVVDLEINNVGPTVNRIEGFSVINPRGHNANVVEYSRNFEFVGFVVKRDLLNDIWPSSSRWGVALRWFNLNDHLFPTAVRSPIVLKNVTFHNFNIGHQNSDGGADRDNAAVVVLDGAVQATEVNQTFSRADNVFHMTSSEVVPRATMNPPGGVYSVRPTVTISAVPGATIYYRLHTGWDVAAGVELYPDAAHLYTGPIAIPATHEKFVLTASVYLPGRAFPFSKPMAQYYQYAPNGTVPTTTGGATTGSAGTTTGSTSGTSSSGATTGTSNTGSTASASTTGGSTAGSTGTGTGGSNTGVTSAGSTTGTTGTGSIVRELWNNVSGTTVAQIPVATAPSATSQLASFEAPSNFGDNYGQRIRGYITAPASGSYTFWIASDDQSELWLSTNDQPSAKVRIASASNWTSSREWNKFASQKSAAITLAAGQRYYVEALMKEGGGGDNLAVGWARPGQATTTPSEVIPGSVLSPFTGSATATGSTTGTASTTGSTTGTTGTTSGTAGTTGSTTGTTGSTGSTTGTGTTSGTAGTTGSTTGTTGSTGSTTGTGTTSGTTGSGSIVRELWNNVSGTAVAQIPVATAPSATSQLASFEAPTNVGDNYGQRIRGYITAPASGSYTFWIASDDQSELWLSTNDQPSAKVRIASASDWTSSRQWNKFASQKSAAITLAAGQRYYVEALMKENGGGDNLAVGWARPGQATTAPSEVIPGSVLSPFTGSTTTGSTTSGGSTTGSAAWTSADVGTVGQTGSMVQTSATAFTVRGSGADIWGNADGFCFATKTSGITGDGQITARVQSLQNTDAWAKAGVMIRDNLNAGSRHVFACVSASQGLAFQRRTVANSSTSTTGATGSAPRWLRLNRAGDTFTAYHSTDGTTWTLIGSETIALSSRVEVGLAVTAHNNGTLNEAHFDNVSVLE